MYLADTLSRAFNSDNTNSYVEQPECIHLADLVIPERQLHEIQTATASDIALQTVKRLITTGWPAHQSDVPPEAQPYFA